MNKCENDGKRKVYLTDRAWMVEESTAGRARITFWMNDFSGIGSSGTRFSLGCTCFSLDYWFRMRIWHGEHGGGWRISALGALFGAHPIRLFVSR